MWYESLFCCSFYFWFQSTLTSGIGQTVGSNRFFMMWSQVDRNVCNVVGPVESTAHCLFTAGGRDLPPLSTWEHWWVFPKMEGLDFWGPQDGERSKVEVEFVDCSLCSWFCFIVLRGGRKGGRTKHCFSVRKHEGSRSSRSQKIVAQSILIEFDIKAKAIQDCTLFFTWAVFQCWSSYSFLQSSDTRYSANTTQPMTQLFCLLVEFRVFRSKLRNITANRANQKQALDPSSTSHSL